MVTLHDVIDIRTGKRYSIAVVSKRNARWFVPANEEGEEEE